MRKLCKFFLCSAVFGFIFLSAMFSLGCGGDDPQCGTDGQPPCDVQQDGGTDGTPIKQDGGDSGIVQTDGGDAGGDPCAAYQGFVGAWSCSGGLPFTCNLTLTASVGKCYLDCQEFGAEMTPDMLQNPNEFKNGNYTCTR